MDFSEQFDVFQQRVTAAQTTVKAAAAESREQIGKRIDQAQVDLNRPLQEQPQQAGDGPDGEQSKWAQMRADAEAKMDDVKTRVDRRNRQLDAKAAASGADWAEAEAADALDFAGWAVDNAQLAMLDAIDARAYADELGAAART